MSDFDIRNYLSHLEPTGEKQKYYCPNCAGHNLSIEPRSGKFNCWNCEDTKAIARELHKLAGDDSQTKRNNKILKAPKSVREGMNGKTMNSNATTAQTETDRTQQTEQVKLAQFSEDYEVVTPEAKKLGDNHFQTRYWYSSTQCIIRNDYPKGKEEVSRSGKTKTIYKKFSYCWLDSDGKENYTKGKHHWDAYRVEEAIAQGCDKYILVVEGESSVEEARKRLRVPTITFRDWNDTGIKPAINRLKDNNVAGIIIFPDYDGEGTKKRKEVQKWCNHLEFPCYALNPTDVWSEMPPSGDIVDWVKSEDFQDMIPENLFNELEQAIHRAVDAQERDRAKAEKEREAQGSDYFVSSDTTLELKLALNSFGDNWMVQDEVFYQYQPNRGYWKKKAEGKVKNFIAHELTKYFTTKESEDGEIEYLYKYAKNSNVRACFEFTQNYLMLDFEPANRHLLSMKNGTVDLRTGELQKHRKDNYLTRHIPLEYKQSDDIPPNFKKFLLQSYGEEQIDLIRAAISMYIDPTAPYGKAVHLIGKSGSGKGFLLRVIKAMIGKENCGSLEDFSILADQDKRHQNLHGKSLIAGPDMSGYVSNLGAFYELVDNGSLSGRRLHGNDAYEKVWNVRFIFASVNPLQVENAGEGWKRRIIPIPTLGNTNSQDRDLETKVIQEELALIFGWALSMPREERDKLLFNSNLWPKANRDLQFEQSTHNDTIRGFIDACLTPSDDPNHAIDTNVLYGYYKAFIKVTGGKQKSQNNFVSGLKNALPELYQGRKTYRENGKRKNTKPKFTNIMLSANFAPDGFGGWNCELQSLQSGGYEAFVNFLESEKTTAVQDSLHTENEAVTSSSSDVTQGYSCHATYRDGGVTNETRSESRSEQFCHGVTASRHQNKDVENMAEINRTSEVDRPNSQQKGYGQRDGVTSVTTSQNPHNVKDSSVTQGVTVGGVTDEPCVTSREMGDEDEGPNKEESDNNEGSDRAPTSETVIDYSTFPATRSDDYRHKEKEAHKIRQQFLGIGSKEEMKQFKASYQGKGKQANWVWHNLLTQAERDRINHAKTVEQAELFANSACSKVATSDDIGGDDSNSSDHF